MKLHQGKKDSSFLSNGIMMRNKEYKQILKKLMKFHRNANKSFI